MTRRRRGYPEPEVWNDPRLVWVEGLTERGAPAAPSGSRPTPCVHELGAGLAASRSPGSPSSESAQQRAETRERRPRVQTRLSFERVPDARIIHEE